MLQDRTRRNDGASLDVRTMEILVQDAANLTFATSNSAELADQSDRGRRFDWSIVEEAGKAHGFDVALALQASHRLLLLGDHKQLPPYNARVFQDLLGDPLRVRKAIQAGARFAPGLIDVSIVDEEEDRDTFEDRCTQWRSMVAFFAALFDASTSGDGGPAATLTDQHRMHPDIADLVGRVFYPASENPRRGTIINSPRETHDKFKVDPPFVIRTGSWLPEQRIVWCNVPWVSKREFAEGEVDGIFVSRGEVDVVVQVLGELSPRGSEACEVQILSPYNDQLDAIRTAVNEAFSKGSLTPMFQEPFDLRQRRRLGATVDEFQGSEADVVIVSLVRNNGLVPWKSIGFLKEANRMNVLLSRARQKLVIVGSWDFFQSRCDRFTSEHAEYAYLRDLMRLAEESRKQGRLAKVDFPR